MVGKFTFRDEDYELLQKVSDYTPIYARINEKQIDHINGPYIGNVWFPLFKWANTCRGFAITTTGIVGVFYGINKNVTMYQYKLGWYDGKEIQPQTQNF